MGFNRTADSGSLTGVSPRPMLVGAPRNAVWAFNAGVSLFLLRCRRPQSRYACFAARCRSLGFSTEEKRHGAPAVRLGAKGTYPICPILRRRPPDGLSSSKFIRHFREIAGKGVSRVQPGADIVNPISY